MLHNREIRGWNWNNRPLNGAKYEIMTKWINYIVLDLAYQFDHEKR